MNKEIVMSKRDKKIREQEFIAKQQKEAIINDVLKFSRKRFKRFDEIIFRLYQGEDLSSFFADVRIARVHECFTRLSSKARATEKVSMKDIFVYLHNISLLFSNEEYIRAVSNMVQFKAYWRKDVFEWKPVSKRGSVQVNELAFYLFCQYPLPGFLYKAFYERNNVPYIYWFIHIGTGRRIKESKAA